MARQQGDGDVANVEQGAGAAQETRKPTVRIEYCTS
jgi:hypothetical protein